MASSRDTRNGPDVTDLIAGMLAFEAINNCRISIRMGRIDKGQRSLMAVEAEAWPRESESGEVQPLASAKLEAGYSGRLTLDAAILQLMYKLDAALAEGEFRKTLGIG